MQTTTYEISGARSRESVENMRASGIIVNIPDPAPFRKPLPPIHDFVSRVSDAKPVLEMTAEDIKAAKGQ